MGTFVRLEVEDGIGTIRLDRPPMNALNEQVQDELHAAATEATENRAVRAVIIYGGEKVFAAGADIKEMAGASYTDMVDRSVRLQAAFTAIARIPKPVVAAVTGYAGRWVRACAVRRLPGCGNAQARPARDPARHHSGCGWHAAPAAPESGPRALRIWSSAAASSRRSRRWKWG